MIRILFIGAGSVNFGGSYGPWDHSRRLEKLDNVKVVGIADPDVKRAEGVLEQKQKGPHASIYSECTVYSSYQAAIEGEHEIDIAFLGVFPNVRGSPNPPHDMELQLLKAGIHIFVEKPVSLEQPDVFQSYVDSVEEVRKEKGLIVSVGYMLRYHPAIEKMKAVLAEYGRPIVGLTALYQGAYTALTDPHWWNMDDSGGPIEQQATHFCDLVRYIGGEVKRESLTGLTVPYSGDEKSVGYLDSVPGSVNEANLSPEQRIPRFTIAHWTFERGGIGSLIHGAVLQGCRYETRIEVWADGLRMTLDDPYSDSCSLNIRKGSDDTEELFTFANADPYLEEDRAFLDAVRSRNEDLVRSSYPDAAKTYSLSWDIRNTSSE